MEKIRILHCLVTVGSGGVEQRRLSLASRLDPEKYEQRLVCATAFGGLPSQFERVGCPIFEVGQFDGINDPNPYRNALSIIKEFRPHICHGAVYEGVALAAIAGRLGRVPIIIGEETIDPKERRVTGHGLYRFLCALTHHLVAISPAVYDYLANRIYNPKSKITLINNGVEERQPPTRREVEIVRAEHGLAQDDLVIGTVGRLVDKHKRVSQLIKVMPLLLEKIPQARLMIVGSGPDEAKLRQMAEELGVGDRTIFVGYQACTRVYYEVMSVFALVSDYEGLPLAVVEGMFASRPVVATRVGGTPLVVADGETGLLINAGDTQAIHDSILLLLTQPALRSRMGERGRERARKMFSAERYVSEVDALYEKLLFERGLL